MTIHRALRILVVEPPPAPGPGAAAWAERSRLLRTGLLENGYAIVAVLPPDALLGDCLVQVQPDLIVVHAAGDARHALEHVVVASRDQRRPIVLFTDDQDIAPVPDAVAAGVSGYIVAGLSPERIRPVLAVAMARFEHEQRLRRELDDARCELGERKLVERAKGVLMQRQGLSEDEAYGKLRRAAMDKGLKLREVARRVLDAADLLS